MHLTAFDGPPDNPIEQLAAEIFETLARQFPVCMSSDEFHFFPQARIPSTPSHHWDDFSPDALENITGRLSLWEDRIDSLLAGSLSTAHVIDASMLLRSVRTLREQFLLVRVHETQPTFYLTLVGIGLTEAMEEGERALDERLERLPGFLDQARENFAHVPALFRDLGMEMIAKQQQWLEALSMPEKHRAVIEEAYRRLRLHLERVPVREDFLPPPELYERISFDHIGCRLEPDAIARELEKELSETASILSQLAAGIAPGHRWQSVVEDLPRPQPPPGGACDVYQTVISELARHCSDHGLIEADTPHAYPVAVKAVPDYMRPVRSNAAYSMPPVYPPEGGTFFIVDDGGSRSIPADYRLLAAHETYPGHHLLDTCRWRHSRPIRRHIEFPLFYEGWASFSEELLFDTGFFSTASDHLLMAKRRFWRAMRGRVDFDIHMRRQTPAEAAAFLASQGMSLARAKAMVLRYCLKPGYQLSYTMGRRRFRRLYDDHYRRQKDPVAFARRVLAAGEIAFHHLEQLLRNGG